MNYIKRILTIIAAIILLYFFTLCFVRIYSQISILLFKNLLGTCRMIFNIIIINLMNLAVVGVCFFLIKKNNNLVNKFKFFIFIILISPLVFHFLDIFKDKSCLDAWTDWRKLLWYIPINLPVCLIIFYIIKQYFRVLFDNKDLIMMFVVFICYQFIKPFWTSNIIEIKVKSFYFISISNDI